MLSKFSQFVNEILADNSRLAKIAILEKYKDDEDIKYLLDFIYNPYITTGVSDRKFRKSLANQEDEIPSLFEPTYTYIENFKDLLEYLKVHNTGRDEDIRTVRHYSMVALGVNYYPASVYQLFENIITKNLQLGIDAKTINKVIPGLIPEFNVQLSNKYFDKPEIVEGKEFAITTKIDGSRIIAMKDNGKVSFWTRQGQPYEGLVDLEVEFRNAVGDNFVLDGEIVAKETTKEDTYKNTMKLSRTKDLEKHGLKMLVFDYIPVADWKMQKCPMAYHTRRAMLGALFDLNNFKYFELLPILYRGTDISMITKILEEQVAKQEEGIMINLWEAPYEFKRTNNLLKVKKFQDTEVEIIGFEEGINKLAGTLGAFICNYKGNELKVGSGLSDEDRDYFWANKEKYLGKFITVKYFEETRNQNGGISLRFPIYMRVREDI